MVGLDEIALAGRQAAAQVHSLARGLLGFAVVTQGAVGLAQLGVRQCKLRIVLNGRLESFQGLEIIALAH